MKTANYSQSDVARVAAMLEAPGTAWDAANVDTEGMAHDILAESTQDGYEGGLVTPLHYRITYGFDAFHHLLELHTFGEATAPGNAHPTDTGVEIDTPHGRWLLSNDQALDLASALIRATADHKNENTPAPAATSNEGSKSFEERSVTTAYLSHRGRSTGVTYGTWSGVSLPMDDYITLVVPLDDVRRMHREGAVPVGINPDCVAEQSREVHLLREEQRAKKREERRRQLSNEIEGELFSEELAAIDAQADAIYSQIEKLVDERLAAGQQEKES